MRFYLEKHTKNLSFVSDILKQEGITLNEKFDLICASVKSKKTIESRPFYTENARFMTFMNKTDDFYLENSEKLSKESRRHLFIDKNTSMAILSVSVICKLLNQLKDDKSISKTNLKMILSRSLLSVNYGTMRSSEDLLENNHMLEIGNFLYHGLVHSSIIIEEEGTNITLSENSKEILRISQTISLSHPSIIQYKCYVKNKKFYPYSLKCEDNLYEMIHLNDSSGIRESMTNVSDDAYDAINYSQSMAYVIREDVLLEIESNLLMNFRQFCKLEENDNPACLKYETIEELMSSRKGMNLDESKYILESWEDSSTQLVFFLSMIVNARMYSGYKLYFRNFYDWRGRLYIDGYPLSPQGGKIARSLLTFPGSKKIVGLDVTASGFQIIGLLMGCVDILRKTRFFDYGGKDLYEKSLESLITTMLKSVELRIYIPVFDRAFYKNLIMCFVYSESNYSRSLKIMDQILKIMFVKVDFKVCHKISKMIVVSFNENNPKVCEFMLIMKDAVKFINNRRKIITFGAKSNFISCVSVYAKQESKRFSFINFVDKKVTKICLKVNKNPLQFSGKKNVSSIVPNFIHHMDALVLNRVILKCISLRIKLFTVHDCFYVSESNEEKIKEIYYRSCEEVFSKPQLRNFLSENNIEDEEIKVKDYPQELNKLFSCERMNSNILK